MTGVFGFVKKQSWPCYSFRRSRIYSSLNSQKVLSVWQSIHPRNFVHRCIFHEVVFPAPALIPRTFDEVESAKPTDFVRLCYIRRAEIQGVGHSTKSNTANDYVESAYSISSKKKESQKITLFFIIWVYLGIAFIQLF